MLLFILAHPICRYWQRNIIEKRKGENVLCLTKRIRILYLSWREKINNNFDPPKDHVISGPMVRHI